MLVESRQRCKNRKYLVFTSAGDHACVHRWLAGQRNFDIFICYYGDVEGRYRDLADHYTQRKGGKFPNLKHILNESEFSLACYSAVFVLDDDLKISAASISKLFVLRETLDLWVVQPAFDRRGKLSFPITRAQPWCLLRYTNFVEVTCPLFEASRLEAFMRVYDPILVGWGADLWFSEFFADGAALRKIAVVDSITCINPRDGSKSCRTREIDTLQSLELRKQTWAKVRETYRLKGEAVIKVEYGQLPLPLTFPNVLGSLKVLVIDFAYGIYKHIDNYRVSRRARQQDS